MESNALRYFCFGLFTPKSVMNKPQAEGKVNSRLYSRKQEQWRLQGGATATPKMTLATPFAPPPPPPPQKQEWSFFRIFFFYIN